jgi:hypothetical protein
MISLFAVSAIYGIVAMLVFRRLTDRAAIRRSMNRIVAHVMELGLFLDSPGLVFGAQRDLLRENARLLRLVMVPGAILALLFALLYPLMDAHFGHAPLAIGEPSVVTIQMKDAVMPLVRLEAPEGVAVETPGVRIVRDRQISWRVRPLRESSGDWNFHVDNRVVTAKFFLRDPAIRSVEIRYPKASVLGFSWLAWFAVISGVSAGLFWQR